MGLDMYLSASKYIGAWEHSETEETASYKAIMRAIDKPKWRNERSPHLTVSVNVAYWRKSNQIHAWFVKNVQGGSDDCGNHYVSREQLVELRDTCVKVLESTMLVKGKVGAGETFEKGKWKRIIEDGEIMADDKVAKELLPTTAGFFFGGTEYDQWYYRDLADTVKQLDAVLAEFDDGWDFEYHASW